MNPDNLSIKIADKFNLEHLRKYVSVYHTLVAHYCEKYNSIALYNNLGRIVLQKVNHTTFSVSINIMNDIYNNLTSNIGFTKDNMNEINQIYRHTRETHFYQIKAKIIYNKVKFNTNNQTWFLPTANAKIKILPAQATNINYHTVPGGTAIAHTPTCIICDNIKGK